MIFGLKRRLGKFVIDVTQNRLCLIEREVAVLEQRYSAKRMFLQVRLGLVFSRRHHLQAISHSLFLKSHLHCAQKRAARHSVNYDIGHDHLLRSMKRATVCGGYVIVPRPRA